MQLTLGRLPKTADTTFLCVFAAVGMLPYAAIRAKGFLAEGLVSSVTYTLTVISGQFAGLGKATWYEVCFGSPTVRVSKSSWSTPDLCVVEMYSCKAIMW